MSEQLLKAILRLFAVVAKEDDVTKQEYDQIKNFLNDHLSNVMVVHYLDIFDQYVKALPARSDGIAKELKLVEAICSEISLQLTVKQKVVIIVELVSIIIADGSASERERQLVNTIGSALNVTASEVECIKNFVISQQSADLDREHVLVASNNLTEKGKHIYRKDLDGFIAILYMASADMYFIRYNGNSDVYLNGVPVKSGVIKVLAIGSTLRWGHDDPIYYGDLLNQFRTFGEHARTSFEGRNISYAFKNGKLGLRQVNLSEESGNLIALMGASGAGKSTLLHVLNGSEKPSEGQVLINGIDIHKSPKAIEGVIGFVPQDDLLIEDLTVYQNLYYAAKLCFSEKGEKEIDELVIRVLTDLGLEETRDLRVGSPLRKTISGGQRKRLNIGLELLREPAVLFCDEPTSGLSSRDSENIIDLLKELSLKGKLVFAVIHQPSSDIYKMFDKLLILDSGGYQIYYGNPVDAIVYFKRAINLANSEQGECHECGNVNPEQVFNIIETKVINEYGHFTNERKMSAEQWNAIFLSHHNLTAVEPSEEQPHSTLNIPSRLKQMHLFSLRDLQAKLHNRQYMIINLLEAPVLAFILAFIVRYYSSEDQTITGYSFGKNLNIPAYLFMSVIVALFMGLTVSAEEIIRDQKILKREAFLHLSRSSYIFSKISILFMLSAVQTLMFVIVGTSILEIKGMLFEHWVILFATSAFANMLGLNISSAFNSAVTIYILIPLLLIPQLILSGVVVKFDKLNPAIGNTATVPFVGDLMVSRWAFEAAMVSQFKDNDYERKFYLYDKVMANSDFKKVYFIPEIETRLQYCISNSNSSDPEVKEKVAADLALIKKELSRELRLTGQKDLPLLEKSTSSTFDAMVLNEVNTFLDGLKKFYSRRYNGADKEKDELILSETNTPEKDKAFKQFKDQYHNEAIAELVKNIAEMHRIIEQDGKLIQKIYPIYKDPDPEHHVDFDAQFYMPTKHFMNSNADTLVFNLAVIWSMSFVLGLMLYFDVLRRIIDGIGNLSNPLGKK